MSETSEEAELDALVLELRAQVSLEQRVAAQSQLDRDALPARLLEFYALADDPFIEAAHRVLMGRSPTGDEAASGGWALRRGTTRATFLHGLARSPDARARGATVPGAARQATLDRLRGILARSQLRRVLRPVLRVARGLRRLLHAAPRLARLDETLSAVRQAAAADHAQRLAGFAAQQAITIAAMEARVAALERAIASTRMAASPPPEP